jgi:hypothetical protein
VRRVDRFLSGPYEDDWFYSEAFWRYYLKRLARSRFNRLTLTVGYVGSFISPPYTPTSSRSRAIRTWR